MSHTFRLHPLPLVLALQAAIAGPVFGASFSVGTGSSDSDGKTLNAGESGSVASGGVLSVADGSVAVAIRAGETTLTNAGEIRQTGSARAIDANNGNPLFTLSNQAGATIDAVGNVAIRLNRTGGQYIIDNQGTISQSGVSVNGERAIKADAAYSTSGNQIINGSEDNRDAVISSTGNDALRLGNQFTLTNYGRIFSTGEVNTSCPGYMSDLCENDYSAADGVAIENERANVAILNHGSIEGPRHGIDGGDPLAADADSDLLGLERLIVRSADGNGVTFAKQIGDEIVEDVQIANPVIINYEDGTIVGNNGSGVGLDGHGVVFNYGTISGRYAGEGNIYDHEGLGETIANGDGDGVDIDGIAYIENHGRIEGLGAGGLDSGGRPNGGDGIAAGGGTILNMEGASIFGQSAGILIDDGANGSSAPSGRGTVDADGAPAANGGVARIVNAGNITGADKVGVGLVGDYDDVLINQASGVILGGAQTLRVDELDSTTAGAAVQMGGGNDSLSNAGLIEGLNGLAVDLGAGDDSLTVLSTARFVGQVDGGAGNDSLVLDDALGGSFGASINFENLDVRNGSWRVDNDDFSGDTRIYAGASLFNLGTLRGDVQVESGATFGGGRVDGDLNLASGSTLALAVSAEGDSDTTSIGGNAALNGANLRIDAISGDYPLQSSYKVLQADGSVTGTFADVTSSLAFLTPSLSYGAQSVELTLARNDRGFADLAYTANGRGAARALESLGSGTLYNAVLTSSSGNAANAIDQLSASSNASLMSASLAGSARVGSSMLGAIQQMGGASNLQASLLREDAPQLAATGVPSAARTLNDPRAEGRLWLQGLGSHGKVDGRNGAHAVSQDTRGAVLGADWALDATWRLGVLGGYGRTDVDAGPGASSDIDSLHLGVYALRQSGPLALRLGAAYSRHDNSSKRRVEFAGFSDRLRGDYDADSQQAFAELGYQMAHGRLLSEPFAAIGYQRYSHEAYREKGGAAALRVDSQEQDNFSSTLGVRLAHLGTLDNGMSLTPRLSVGWRHTYGDVDSSARQTFLSGGSAFSVEGTALDRDSLLLEAGVDLGISRRQSLGLGYSGEQGSRAQNHALLLQWQSRF
ncbi:autotransporter outer membrane beta-barrel domain-containing protein [Stutzerimonas kirkiae]|uniref:autotransporter family protein n=1 Tax=Stutzerimonas kirkiae TaxID=2211392 RepID=UPI001F602713|nr:autotransporter outer membrane beta-barrel domain-containing protein [Stutzerimonas kirkiae]